MIVGILLVVLLLVTLLAGVPIGVSIGVTSVAWLADTGLDISALASRMQGGINSFTLMSIPFFILAAEIMNVVGITEKLMDFCSMALARFRGGLAYVCIFTGMIFASITGSALANCAALSKVFIPKMVDQGYKKPWAVANLVNSALLGPIIPPSITLVLYGAVTGVSIGGLLLGGLIPGIFMGLVQSLYVFIIGKKDGLPKVETHYTKKEIVSVSLAAIPSLLMPVIIIGGIYSGKATPTEAAALAVGYALLLGFVFYRTLKPGALLQAGKQTMRDSTTMFFVVGVSNLLSWLIARTGLAVKFSTFMLSLSDNPNVIFFLVILLLLFMGTWLDSSAIIILVAPIVAPMMEGIGVDPIHFGVVFIVCVTLGLITPPLGMCLFVASTANKMSVTPIIKKMVPFLILDVAIIAVLTLVPDITVWLPHSTGF